MMPCRSRKTEERPLKAMSKTLNQYQTPSLQQHQIQLLSQMAGSKPGWSFLAGFAPCSALLAGSTVRLTQLNLVGPVTPAYRSSGIGIFQDYYQSHQLSSYSPSTIAWIPSTESFMLFFWVRGQYHIISKLKR